MSGIDDLLDELVPGAGTGGRADPEAPPLPRALGLEPIALLGRYRFVSFRLVSERPRPITG